MKCNDAFNCKNGESLLHFCTENLIASWLSSAEKMGFLELVCPVSSVVLAWEMHKEKLKSLKFTKKEENREEHWASLIYFKYGCIFHTWCPLLLQAEFTYDRNSIMIIFYLQSSWSICKIYWGRLYYQQHHLCFTGCHNKLHNKQKYCHSLSIFKFFSQFTERKVIDCSMKCFVTLFSMQTWRYWPDSHKSSNISQTIRDKANSVRILSI